MKFRNICILRSGAIGDIVHTLPLVNILNKAFKHKKITYAMAPELVPLMKYAKGINQIFPLNLKTGFKDILDQADDLKNYGETRFTDFINLQPSWKSKLLGWWLRPENSYNYKKDKTLKLHAWQNFALSFFHPSDLDLTDFDLAEELPLIKLPSEIVLKTSISLKLTSRQQVLVLVPGVGKQRPHRAWPVKHWINFLKILDLHEEHPPEVFLVGGPDEIKICQEISSRVPTSRRLKVVNLCAKFDLLNTAALLNRANLVIGGDTGPTHLAAALNTETIAMFGPTSAERHAPFKGVALNAPDYICSQSCTPKKCDRRVLNCMESLTPDQVWMLMNEMLSFNS
jgi:heptosyltransferase I